MTNKNWCFKDLPQQEKITSLSIAININPFLARLLLQRDITNYDQAFRFFRPTKEQLHDPFMMQDMEQAVSRINLAIEKQEKVLIYGDYDVDGTTSVAMVYHYLKQYHPALAHYIPDRYKEGYGISQQAVEWANENDFSLIIALDCGIKAYDQVALAKEYGIDFIICDHHQPGKQLPGAFAVLDPKRDDCSYPYKELSGCGVGFKLIQALAAHNNWPAETVNEYLDLVAVSIASDLVPITGENRILAFHGLIKIAENPRPGLKALLQIAGIKAPIGISNIVFGIGPRINAAGRIDHANAALQLLLAEDLETGMQYGRQLDIQNSQRKDYDKETTLEALSMIDGNHALTAAKSTVLFQHHWHKGVIGIVASRCMERYHRPTIIMTESGGVIAGSARSVNDFNVYQAIAQCKDLLIQFGGHQYAAGLTLMPDQLTAFQERFEKVVAGSITEEQLIEQLEIDLTLNFDRITYKFYRILRQMEPFGPGNMQPLFCTRGVHLINSPRIMKEEHLRMFLKQESSSTSFEAIGFGMRSYLPVINSGKALDIVYSIEENSYYGGTSLILHLKDLRISE